MQIASTRVSFAAMDMHPASRPDREKRFVHAAELRLSVSHVEIDDCSWIRVASPLERWNFMFFVDSRYACRHAETARPFISRLFSL